PVDGSVSAKQGIRLLLSDGSRAICRLSGTGTEGATLRLYLERYRADGGTGEINEVLAPLAYAARELLKLKEYCDREEPTIIT
ncbi:MAG TPA: alpha-D-glucose phosphate-specific phosphoglucomutase, partial [Blastocatellia bacterium]|nr:alpha-D-glucose phosphate-specific phosphoglucomutase [Blastocatellia bacterium]